MSTRPGLELSPAPTWRGRLAVPVRKLLLKLMRPMFGRFTRAHDEIMGQLGAVSMRVDEAHVRLNRLTEETAAANALAWDQVALARRLSQIEERLDAREQDRDAAGSAGADHARTG